MGLYHQVRVLCSVVSAERKVTCGQTVVAPFLPVLVASCRGVLLSLY